MAIRDTGVAVFFCIAPRKVSRRDDSIYKNHKKAEHHLMLRFFCSLMSRGLGIPRELRVLAVQIFL
jgi:uncharacterized protein YcgI (DUF1989 family)